MKQATVFVALGIAGLALVGWALLSARSGAVATNVAGKPDRSNADLNEYGAYPPLTQQSPRPGPPGASETLDRAEVALSTIRGGISVFEEIKRVFR